MKEPVITVNYYKFATGFAGGITVMNVIAGDIGGTKSWLVWLQMDAHESVVCFEHVYASESFPDVEALLQQFLNDAAQSMASASVPVPSVYCLALPGPVQQGRSVLTNLDWHLDETKLATHFNATHVLLFNDFQAAALGVETLSNDDYLHINTVDAELQGIRAITGAGTGLGLAWMHYTDANRGYDVYATEGGHTDFAPANAQQQDVLHFFRTEYVHEFTHVSWERFLSGDGITRLYQYCLSVAGVSTEVDKSDKLNAESINARAQQGDPVAQATMQLFADIYANWLGNVALLYQPKGGLFIAGGIATHTVPWLQSERFLMAYADKGRMQSLVTSVPLYLITNTRLGVQGAIHRARRLLYDTGQLSRM